MVQFRLFRVLLLKRAEPVFLDAPQNGKAKTLASKVAVWDGEESCGVWGGGVLWGAVGFFAVLWVLWGVGCELWV